MLADRRERRDRARQIELDRLAMWGGIKDINQRIQKDWDD